MFFYAAISFLLVYIFCYARSVKKPTLIYQENDYTSHLVKSVPAFHNYFFPFIIYTKGFIESKVYQYRNICPRSFNRISITGDDEGEIFIDVYDGKETAEKNTSLYKFYEIFDKINTNFKKYKEIVDGKSYFKGRKITKNSSLESKTIDFTEPSLVSNKEKNSTSETTPPLTKIPFDSRNNVLLVHGFNGSSSVSYIKSLAHILRDYRIFAFNARGVMSELKTEKFFHIGWTEDLEKAVIYISSRFTGSITLIGFSMGASWVTNYLSKNQNPRVIGGIGVCVPFDFNSLSFAQRHSCISVLMAIEFKKYLDKHKVFTKFNYNSLKSVEQIDSLVTTKVYGFGSYEDYYSSQSCRKRLSGVKVPLLFINTKDDPLIPIDTVPVDEIKKNPWLILCVLEAGGHLGLMDLFMKNSFLEIVVKDFLEALNKKK